MRVGLSSDRWPCRTLFFRKKRHDGRRTLRANRLGLPSLARGGGCAASTYSVVSRCAVAGSADRRFRRALTTVEGTCPAKRASSSGEQPRIGAIRSASCFEGGALPASTRDKYAGSISSCAATPRRVNFCVFRNRRMCGPNFMSGRVATVDKTVNARWRFCGQHSLVVDPRAVRLLG